MKADEIKIGMHVEVFNLVGRNWEGTVRRIGKKFCAVEVDPLPSGNSRTVFTHHNDARGQEINAYLVAPMDILRKCELPPHMQPNPSPARAEKA